MADRKSTVEFLASLDKDLIVYKGPKNWTKQGAEFFPVASGVQIPYVGQDDSVDISAGCFSQATLLSRANSPASLKQPNSRKKLVNPKTRPLGDVLDPFPTETAQNLNNKLPQTFLYLPDIGAKREKKQRKQNVKEIGRNLNFTNDVVAKHCSIDVLDYDKDELNKTVYQHKTGNRAKMISVVSHHVAHRPLKHVPCHLSGSELSSRALKSDNFPKIDDDMKQEMEEILFSVARSTRPRGYSIVKVDKPETLVQFSSEWDEYVLALLSKSTAKWLTSEFSSGTQHVRLTSFLNERYQEKDPEKERRKSIVERAKDDPATKRRNRKAGTELEKVLTEAIFDAHYSPSFTLPLAVGDKKLVTNNAFQQEMLAGAFPLKGRRTHTRKSIVLNTNSNVTFEKKLQSNYPEDPKKWSNTRRNSKGVEVPGNSKVVKGLRRWNQLPSLLQDETYVPSFKSFDDKPAKTLGEVELLSANRTRENNNVLRISDEWRSKWLLEKRWQNASTAELIQGMNDINDHVRLAAVAACGKAAEVRQRKKTEQPFGTCTGKETSNVEKMTNELESELLDCVMKLLEDHCKQVRITAAVTLCTLNISESKAVDILLETLQSGSAIERWIAAQCLASAGHCTDNVITEILSQTSSNDLLRQEQAAILLLKLSQQSYLVHAIVAEQLNSSSCQDRLVACRILPRLNGTLNKDVAQKLSHMMWNDWQKSVRTAAAQALGRTGNGKLVHDALLKRMLDDNERIKVDALRKLSNLGIMTAHLLPAFLSCFTSEFVSVRIEAAMAAGVINTPDDDIVAALVKLANDDHSWKVKAYAIKALGIIKKITDDVVDMLVWSMRYSKLAAVRAEACNAVGELGLRESRVLSVLQDRLIVETEEIVRSEARRTLKSLDIEFTGDVEMINTIRSEVKRLCNKDNVVSSILERDREEDYERDYQRMIATDGTAQYRCTQTPPTGGSLKSEESSRRGWDPILAGFRARSVMSEPSTPIVFKMERSRLPMDLNSASSEESLGSRDDLESEYPDSITSHLTNEEFKIVINENYPNESNETINNTDDVP